MNDFSANIGMAYLAAKDAEETTLRNLPQVYFVSRPIHDGVRIPHSQELLGILLEAFSSYTDKRVELDVQAMGNYFQKKFYKVASGSLMFDGYETLGYLARKGELASIIVRAANKILARTQDVEPVEKATDRIYNSLFADYE